MSKDRPKGAELKDYYASWAGIAGWGPAHALVELIVDEKSVWRSSSPVLRSASANPYQFDVDGYGRVYFYWGTPDQNLTDPVLRPPREDIQLPPGYDDFESYLQYPAEIPGDMGHYTRGHPPYRRRILVVFQDFLCGRERTNVPNIKVIYWRKPQQTLITGPAGELDSDGQCNPLCALVERITDRARGLGNPNSFFKADAWQTLADEIYADRANQYLSLDLAQAGSVRDLAGEINNYLDTYFWTDAAGLLGVGRFLEDSSVPSGLPRIDEHDLAKGSLLTIQPQPLTANSSRVELRYVDRAKKYEERTVRYEDQRLQSVTESDQADTLQRPWIRRARQANRAVASAGAKLARPAERVEGTFRPEKTKSLDPGDLVVVAKPSTSFEGVCRVLQKESDGDDAGATRLSLERERMLAPAPGDFDEDELPEESEFPLQDARYWHVVQPPAALAEGDPFRLAALVGQDHGTWRGAQIYFRDQATEFSLLGLQNTFAVPVNLSAGASSSATSISVRQPDPAAFGFDQLNAAPTADEIADNELLFILVDPDAPKNIEICTVRSIGAPSSGVYTVSVDRGSYESTKLTWSAGDPAYLIPRRNLTILDHGAIEEMARRSSATDRLAKLKVVPYRPDGALPLADATQKRLEIRTELPVALTGLTVTAKPGALQIGWIPSMESDAFRTEIEVSTGRQFPDADTIKFRVPWDLQPYTVINLDPDLEYYVRIRSVDTSQLEGPWTTHPTSVAAGPRPGADDGATLYYIQPARGTAIHNGQGTLEVVAYRATPTGSEALTSGTIKLYNPLKQEVTEANGYAAGSDSYTGVLDSGDISGSIIISLRDGPDGTPLDTIALIDVADGADGDPGTPGEDAVFGSIEPSGPLAWIKQKNDAGWLPATTMLDFDTTFYIAGEAAARKAIRITRADDGSLTYGNTLHKDGNLNDSRISVDGLGSGTTTLTLKFLYSHEDKEAVVSETALAVQEGSDPIVFEISPNSAWAWEQASDDSWSPSSATQRFDVDVKRGGDTLARMAILATLNVSTGGISVTKVGQTHAQGNLNAGSIGLRIIQLPGETWKSVVIDYTHPGVNLSAVGSLSLQSFPNQAVSTPLQPPGAPGTPSVSSKTSNSASLSWTAPTTGGPVTQYRIQYATDSSFTNPSTFFSQGTDTSRTVTGLNPSTRYYFRVRAENSGGNSSYSSSVDTTTDAGSVTAPGTPGTPTQTGRTSLSLSLSCAVPSTGTTPTLYRWEYSFNSSFSSPSEVTSTINSVTITSLGSDRTYYVRVRAENSAGNSSYSSALQTSTLPLVSAPLAPNTPTKESGTSSSLSVKTPIITPGTVSTATLYRWQHSTDSSFSNPSEVTSTGRTTTITGLEPETTYYIRVRAENSGGNSSYSGTLTASTDARSFGDWGSSVFGTETSTFDCNTAPDGFSRAAPSASNVPSGATTGGYVYTFADGKQLFIQTPTVGAITVVHYRATKTGSWTTTIPSDLVITDADTQLSSDGVQAIEITASSNTPPTTDSAIELSAEGLIQVVGNTQTYYGYVTKKWTRTVS